MPNHDAVIELKRVSKAFGTQKVLDDVDLQVFPSQTTVIIGRSGTGKSVLLKHIVGLLRPDRGEVYYKQRRIDQLPERKLSGVRREVSFVFQLNALFDSLSVRENVAFQMRENSTKRVSRAEIERIVGRCLELVGLGGYGDKRPADLSGGEKKRVALARAIAVEPPPKVILYDEPTAGLDPQRADAINKLIQHMQRELDVTSIVVTHDMQSAREVGDRILMLWDGRFITDVPPAELDQVEDERVRRFVTGRAEDADLQTLAR